MTQPASQDSKSPANGLSRELRVKTARRTQLVDITRDVEKVVAASGCRSGICYLYVPHTTAAITINENDDPDVPRDIEAALDRLVPKDGPYKHWEGNADSHIKSAMVGCSKSIPIEGGHLALGRWQAIFFCEFDGPRDRQVNVQIIRA
jgi:secondary thiamine-phosphate synthase enzyme